MAENFFIFCVLCALFYFLKYLFKKRKIYGLSWTLPGPVAFPLIGNALTFFCDNEDVFERVVSVIQKYPSPMRFWLGPKFVIMFSEPEQAAKVLTSMNFSHKDEIYRFMKIFNGEGLISGSGPKWKRDRKLIGPLFSKKNVEEYFSCICNHTNILLEKLEAETGQASFSVEKYIHRCAADFVNDLKLVLPESIMGIKTDAQNGKFDDFLQAIDRAYDLVHARMVKVWLQVEWIFKLTRYWNQQENDKNEIHHFFRNVIRAAKRDHHKGDQSLLNQILDLNNEFPDFATEDELVHHLATLYTASEDTVTTITSFTLLLLGMYPQIQQKIVDEIDQIFGKRRLDLDGLSKLHYLEMCIKDVLRLFPIAPFVIRTSAKDYQIDQWTIPRGCSVVVAIHNIHRNPEYWQRPNEFYPEHFLPDVVAKRQTYAYVPFSAGVRSCLGKSYANMALKILVALVVRKYVIRADGKLQDIQLKTDISVRPKNRQFPIRIELRPKKL